MIEASKKRSSQFEDLHFISLLHGPYRGSKVFESGYDSHIYTSLLEAVVGELLNREPENGPVSTAADIATAFTCIAAPEQSIPFNFDRDGTKSDYH